MTIVSQKGASKPSVRTPQLVRVETSPDRKADNALLLSCVHSTETAVGGIASAKREHCCGMYVAKYSEVGGKSGRFLLKIVFFGGGAQAKINSTLVIAARHYDSGRAHAH